jgi:putative MATE family efflux protein
MATADESSDIDVLEDEIEKVSSPETLSVWGLAWPSIIANILFAAVGIVGLKAVGALGTEALAAVGTGQRIFFVIQSLIMAVSTGTTALIARAYGSGNKEEGAKVLFESLWIGISLGLLTTAVVWIYGEDIIGLFGLDTQSKILAINYLKFSMLFSAMFSASFIFGAALRAAGDAKTPLAIMVFQNIINVFLLIGLVNGSFGLPNLGVIGAALAWGISFTVGTFICFFLWLTKLTIIPVPKFNSFNSKRIKLILKISTPATIEQGIFQLGLLIYFWIISLYGTAPIAAYNIGINILMLSFMIGQGFSIAGATLTGQFLGADNPKEAKRSGWRSAGFSIISMTIIGLFVAIFSREISGFLINDPEVIRLTVIFVWFLGSMQPLMAIEFALGGALRGAGDTKSPLIITMIGLVFFRLSVAFIFLYFNLPIEYIFSSLIVDYFVKAILFSYRFNSGKWIKKLT